MDDIRNPTSPNTTRFMERFRLHIRARHLAYKTDKTYCYWDWFYIRFHDRRNPQTMGEREIEAFLEHLSSQLNVAANTQKTALNALVFLYRNFLGIEIGKLKFTYAQRPRQSPTVFSHEKATAVLNRLSGLYWLTALLMYGSGLRVSEAARLRIARYRARWKSLRRARNKRCQVASDAVTPFL